MIRLVGFRDALNGRFIERFPLLLAPGMDLPGLVLEGDWVGLFGCEGPDKAGWRVDFCWLELRWGGRLDGRLAAGLGTDPRLDPELGRLF
jgi:hypothetical protein